MPSWCGQCPLGGATEAPSHRYHFMLALARLGLAFVNRGSQVRYISYFVLVAHLSFRFQVVGNCSYHRRAPHVSPTGHESVTNNFR